MSADLPPSGGAPSATAERLRFLDFTFQRLPNGRCRAKVVLGRIGTDSFTGQADGVTSPAGELRCSAEAAVQALGEAVEAEIDFELLGVKAVRAFDATVVIVSLSSRQASKATRLVGTYLTETDPPRGAALAVLNATNRILGNHFSTR
ncbi:MAG TPA: hypothetical protein VMC86_12275 [Gemmatimonadales bacterium]|nr:hypothetical protein [Gemmatimonadales bacterium]